MVYSLDIPRRCHDQVNSSSRTASVPSSGPFSLARTKGLEAEADSSSGHEYYLARHP